MLDIFLAWLSLSPFPSTTATESCNRISYSNSSRSAGASLDHLARRSSLTSDFFQWADDFTCLTAKFIFFIVSLFSTFIREFNKLFSFSHSLTLSLQLIFVSISSSVFVWLLKIRYNNLNMFTFFALLHCAMRLCEQINTRYFIGTVIGLFLGLFQLYSNYLSEKQRHCERSAVARLWVKSFTLRIFHTRESQKHATSSPLLFRQATHTRHFALFLLLRKPIHSRSPVFPPAACDSRENFPFKATFFSLFAVELVMKKGKMYRLTRNICLMAIGMRTVHLRNKYFSGSFVTRPSALCLHH